MKTPLFNLFALSLFSHLDSAIRSVFAVNPRLIQESGSRLIPSNVSFGPRNHLSTRTIRHHHPKRDAVLSITPDVSSVDETVSSVLDVPVTSNVGDVVSETEANPKYVVAHFMVGNTYPYTIDDWRSDIQLASSFAIDGFALNIGRDEWMGARVADAYSAAQSIGDSFKLFLSLDMTSLPCATQSDMQALQAWIVTYAHHPSQLIYNGRPLVSTFAGEGCSYGGDYVSTWTSFKQSLEENVYFVPSLFIDPTKFNSFPFLDGAFNWNGGWPTQLSASSTPSQIEQAVGSLDTDISFLNNLSGKTYIAPVSPWFFTHYGPDTWNKNWIYRGDDWLFARRWENLITIRDGIDLIEIISWNDYGESHYVGPIKGAQPNSQAWVDGFDHQGWLEVIKYYATAFKQGSYPPVIQDEVFLWARPHPRDAEAPDPVPRPDNAELTEDFFWAVVFAKAPATVILYTPERDDADSESTIDYSTSMVCDIPAGISKMRYPLYAGKTMAIQLKRAGATVLDYKADGFVFNPTPPTYNFNAWVGWKAGS